MVYLAHFLLEELAGGMRGLGEGPRGRWATNEVGDPWGFRSPLYSGISWDCEGRVDPGGQSLGQVGRGLTSNPEPDHCDEWPGDCMGKPYKSCR